MAQKTPKDRQSIGFLLFDDGRGRIANALSKAISYERDPKLFDEEYIKNRDKELKELQKTKDADKSLCIDRRNKPVVLTSYQSRIIHALSYAISREMQTSEDVKKKVEDAFNKNDGNVIKRIVNISNLTRLICNSTRKRYKDRIINEIYNLSRVRQVQFISYKNKTYKLTTPFITLGADLEDVTPNPEIKTDAEDISKNAETNDNSDFIEIQFCSTFFYKLSSRYAIITPKLFEVWSKKGRGTELFDVLLSSLFSVYWTCMQAANNAETHVREDFSNRELSMEELRKAIADARQDAMRYELNISSIKRKVRTDYDSNPKMKRQFWIDLQNAINGYIEYHLITDAIIQKGAKGQDKIIFTLSENYYLVETENTRRPILLTKQDDKELSAF